MLGGLVDRRSYFDPVTKSPKLLYRNDTADHYKPWYSCGGMAPLIRNSKRQMAVGCELRHSALNMRMSKYLVLQAIKSAVSLALPGIQRGSVRSADRS